MGIGVVQMFPRRGSKEPNKTLWSQATWFPAPQPSSFLQPGVTLSGTQLVSRRNRIREDWNVTVEIEVREAT